MIRNVQLNKSDVFIQKEIRKTLWVRHSLKISAWRLNHPNTGSSRGVVRFINESLCSVATQKKIVVFKIQLCVCHLHKESLLTLILRFYLPIL